MSEPAAPIPDYAEDPLPPRRPIAGAFDFMVRGWRSAASWMCVAILGVFGVVAPIVALVRHQEPHLDLAVLGILLGALKLASDRKQERLERVTS